MIFVILWWFLSYPLRVLIGIFGFRPDTFDVCYYPAFAVGIPLFNGLLSGLLFAIIGSQLYERRARA